MPQWADYGISKVRYDHDNHRIVEAAVVPNAYYTAGGEVAMTRQEIIEAMRQGKTFVAVSRHGNIWRKGADVFLIEVEGESYIRMHHAHVPMDSRDGLAEF